MKYKYFLLTCCLIPLLSFAQIQRTAKPSVKTDTVNNSRLVNTFGELNNGNIMKELNLTNEQKLKIRDFRQSNQIKKDSISNDDKLSAEQKEAKLKQLKKEQFQSVQSILTDNQKKK